MPRHGRKVQHSNDRRVSRLRKTELPDIPVLASDPSVPSVAKTSADNAQSAAQPDQTEEQIRRMIEAAYT
jgi:hypothetical protein